MNYHLWCCQLHGVLCFESFTWWRKRLFNHNHAIHCFGIPVSNGTFLIDCLFRSFAPPLGTLHCLHHVSIEFLSTWRNRRPTCFLWPEQLWWCFDLFFSSFGISSTLINPFPSPSNTLERPGKSNWWRLKHTPQDWRRICVRLDLTWPQTHTTWSSIASKQTQRKIDRPRHCRTEPLWARAIKRSIETTWPPTVVRSCPMQWYTMHHWNI